MSENLLAKKKHADEFIDSLIKVITREQLTWIRRNEVAFRYLVLQLAIDSETMSMSDKYHGQVPFKSVKKSAENITYLRKLISTSEILKEAVFASHERGQRLSRFPVGYLVIVLMSDLVSAMTAGTIYRSDTNEHMICK